MGAQPEGRMVEVGSVIARFKGAKAIGVNITGSGFCKGDTLFVDSPKSHGYSGKFTADSIQIDGHDQEVVMTGQQCAVAFPGQLEDLPLKHSMVYVWVPETAPATSVSSECSDPLDSQVCQKGDDRE